MYYDSLSMEARSIVITKSYIRVMSRRGLEALKGVLGSGVGLGMAKARPTKNHPFVTCTIGTSVELNDNIPMELIKTPLLPWSGNGIDFIYTEETTQLSCFLRYTKIPVSNAEVATSRTSRAQVQPPLVSAAYINCSFFL